MSLLEKARQNRKIALATRQRRIDDAVGFRTRRGAANRNAAPVFARVA